MTSRNCCASLPKPWLYSLIKKKKKKPCEIHSFNYLVLTILKCLITDIWKGCSELYSFGLWVYIISIWEIAWISWHTSFLYAAGWGKQMKNTAKLWGNSLLALWYLSAHKSVRASLQHLVDTDFSHLLSYTSTIFLSLVYLCLRWSKWQELAILTVICHPAANNRSTQGTAGTFSVSPKLWYPNTD